MTSFFKIERYGEPIVDCTPPNMKPLGGDKFDVWCATVDVLIDEKSILHKQYICEKALESKEYLNKLDTTGVELEQSYETFSSNRDIEAKLAKLLFDSVLEHQVTRVVMRSHNVKNPDYIKNKWNFDLIELAMRGFCD